MSIGALVFVGVMYSLIAFRMSKSVESAIHPKRLFVEICWALVPFMMVILLVIPSAYVLMRS